MAPPTEVRPNEKMKAVVQNGYGSPDFLELRDVERPALGDDGVLVRVRAASVNAADWHLLGTMPHLVGVLLRASRTSVRGIDLAGEVEAVGKSVSGFRPGDEVFGAGLGTFAEYATSLPTRLAPKPRNLTFEQAATIPVAGITALQGLRDKAHLEPGQRALIYGAGGGVGTFAVQVAKALGAHVTAVTCAGNVGLVRSIGADEVVDYEKEDFTRRGQRYDVLFDNGANRSLADCRRALAPRGTLVLVGAASGMWRIVSRLLTARLITRADGQRFAPFLARVMHEDLLALEDLAEAGKLTPVIDRQFPLSEAPDALRYVGTRQARGKVVIRVA